MLTTKCLKSCLILLRSSSKESFGAQFQNRFLSTARKRFYKKVSISRNEDKFEINLDSRKLKTPNGNLFYTRNEALSVCIANEWNMQQSLIQLHQMHLTQLTNTAIDNPLNRSQQHIVESILNFIESDTICFRVAEPPELQQLQRNKWDPIIDWFQQRFECKIPVTDCVDLTPIPVAVKQILSRHLRSHNDWSLIGLLFAVENLKSLILSLALTERRINVEEAISLSRLEEEFQIKRWGSVEWAHDLDAQVLRARVSAALLFFLLNCETNQMIKKGVNSMNA